MTLQGFLHADEYGSAASMVGGMSLTMTIWGEALSAGTRALFGSEPRFVPLPKALVLAALHETARHPGLQIVPQLQKKIKEHQRTWERFREQEMGWMLEHADLVGGLLNEPEALPLWSLWSDRVADTETQLTAAKAKECAVSMFHQVSCQAAAATVTYLERVLAAQKEVVTQWDRVLTLSRWASSRALLSAVQNATSVGGIMTVAEFDAAAETAEKNNRMFVEFEQEIAKLHDVTEPSDGRLAFLVGQTHNIAWNLTVGYGNHWLRRLLESLLITEVWTGCLDHVLQRESRVRRLMVAAGVQELFTVHERILNASLVVTTNAMETRLLQDWFGEMASYAWWLPEEVPSLVRRCVGQEAGDCIRIGPTEIVALSSQIAERSRIVEDWVRCVFIGMWNSLPAICLLFVVEIIMVCLSMRLPAVYLPQQLPQLPQLPQPQQPLLENEPRRPRPRRQIQNHRPFLLRNV